MPSVFAMRGMGGNRRFFEIEYVLTVCWVCEVTEWFVKAVVFGRPWLLYLHLGIQYN